MHKDGGWLVGALLAGLEVSGAVVAASVAFVGPAVLAAALEVSGEAVSEAVSEAVVELVPEVVAGSTGACAPHAASDAPNPSTAANVRSFVKLPRVGRSRCAYAVVMPPLLLSCFA